MHASLLICLFISATYHFHYECVYSNPMHVEIRVCLHTGIVVASLCMSTLYSFVSDKLSHSRYDRTNLCMCICEYNIM